MDFTQILQTLGPSVANMTVLVIVVKLFLVDRKDARDAQAVERKEMVDKITSLHQEHMIARSETRQVMADVAKSMHEVSLALEACHLKM